MRVMPRAHFLVTVVSACGSGDSVPEAENVAHSVAGIVVGLVGLSGAVLLSLSARRVRSGHVPPSGVVHRRRWGT
jgi:hypothetical protein